jgi:hypothetical protein
VVANTGRCGTSLRVEGASDEATWVEALTSNEPNKNWQNRKVLSQGTGISRSSIVDSEVCAVAGKAKSRLKSMDFAAVQANFRPFILCKPDQTRLNYPPCRPPMKKASANSIWGDTYATKRENLPQNDLPARVSPGFSGFFGLKIFPRHGAFACGRRSYQTPLFK